jgi:hypothetical protein
MLDSQQQQVADWQHWFLNGNAEGPTKPPNTINFVI